MLNNFFFKCFLFLVCISFFVSCDKEYGVVGAALIGDNNFLFDKLSSDVVAYNEKMGPVASQNLAVNALGIYSNPAFGTTTACFATQIVMASPGPTIGNNAEIESVYLNVPYFYELPPVALESGGYTYVLDSIYGEKLAKIKLRVYESGVYMGKQSGIDQTFYTNQKPLFDKYIVGDHLNNDSDVSQNDEFFFDPTQISSIVTDDSGKETTVYSSPSMRLKLDATFFKNKILLAAASDIANNSNFVNYFKGLYFKVEQSGTDSGSLAMLNFAKGTITIKYKEDTSDADKTRVDKTILLNMSGVTANLLDQTNTNIDYSKAVKNPNSDTGDDRLYVKGGEGAVSVIKLFGDDLFGADGVSGSPNGVADELDIIRYNGWLINEANLVFHIDQTKMSSAYEPQRIYLYDCTNNTLLADYTYDSSSSNSVKNNNKVTFGGIISLDDSGKGSSYKLRITNHIRNLVKNTDNVNVKLGLVVTEDINTVSYKNLETETTTFSKIPTASVMNPLGTVLYGGTTSEKVPKDKKLKLEIYYTKPN